MTTARAFKNLANKKIYPFESIGFVRYQDNSCTLEIPRDFSPFYRALIPRYMGGGPLFPLNTLRTLLL